MREVFAELSRELAGATGELGGLLERDLADLNRTAGGLGLPTVYVPAEGGS